MIDRRKWLSVLIQGGSAAVAAVVGIPALLAAISPGWRSRPSGQWRTTGRLEDFPIGKVQPAVIEVGRGDWARSLETKTVYVYRRSDADAVVYSRNCTDLSCPLVFDGGSECFFCPCHGGIFDKDGQPMAGPPSKPLYRYATRVREGELEIDLYSLPPMT